MPEKLRRMRRAAWTPRKQRVEAAVFSPEDCRSDTVPDLGHVHALDGVPPEEIECVTRDIAAQCKETVEGMVYAKIYGLERVKP